MKKLSRKKVDGLRRGTRNGTYRTGFTLVELLVVIAIIGLLVGLTVPAVFAVRGSVIRSAIKFEVQGLADAIDKYRAEKGDYPPDGSSWNVMELHLRKAFPNILQSELNLLNPAMYSSQVGSIADIRNDSDTLSGPDFRVMEPAEALVFFLGGFSKDSQRPFTGQGGPFVATGNAQQGYAYNSARQNPYFEFDSNRLTLATVNGLVISDDEPTFNQYPAQDTQRNVPSPDLLPVFISRYTTKTDGSPYVYFDSRTYQTLKGSAVFYNYYQPSRLSDASGGPLRSATTQYGAARPFLLDQSDTAVSTAVKPQKYANAETFQILSPGSDGAYGGRTTTAVVGGAQFIAFTTTGVPCYRNTTLESVFGIKSSLVKGAYIRGPYTLDEHMAGTNVRIRPAQDDSGNFIDVDTLGQAINATN